MLLVRYSNIDHFTKPFLINNFMNIRSIITILETIESSEETHHGDEFYKAYGNLPWPEDSELLEAEYHGHKVPLGKPMRGDIKKFKVYLKKGDRVVKVNFGDPNMRIRRSNPKARKSFRARHHCENPGSRYKARYWSCRNW